MSASACQPKKLMVLPVRFGASREHVVEIDRAGHHEYREDAEREAEIADAVDHEGLDGGRVRLRLVVPEADQQIAREPDALPAEEQLHQIVRRHQHQHREGEQRQVGEEARPVRILLHVADRIEVHEGRHGVDHHQHHGGQRVDADGPVDLQVARIDPGEQHLARVLVLEADAPQRHPGQHHRDEQEQRGDELGRARAGGRRLGRMAVRRMIVMGRRARGRRGHARHGGRCRTDCRPDGARARRRARSRPRRCSRAMGERRWPDTCGSLSSLLRHARPCAGHPRLAVGKAWMAGHLCAKTALRACSPATTECMVTSPVKFTPSSG